MPQVDALQTPSTPSAVGGALTRAYRTVLGRDPPTRESWVIPLAQAAVETAHFQGGLWNNNIGNITSGNPNAEDWMYLPGNGLRFRSYPDLDAGAASLISWLNHHGAISYADVGDISSYVAALQKGCYVGCDPAVYPGYQRNIESYAGQYGAVIPTVPSRSNFTTFAVVAAILAASGLAAVFVHEGPDPIRMLKRALR